MVLEFILLLSSPLDKNDDQTLKKVLLKQNKPVL
ncbi:MAG: hypothetical protein ACI9SG_002398, partial [Maribacter sp.]